MTSRKILYVSITFIGALLTFEMWVFHINFADYFIKLFLAKHVNNQLHLFLVSPIVIFITFLAAIGFVQVSLISNIFFRIIYFFIFSIAVFLEYGVANALGRYSTTATIHTALIFNDSSLWLNAITAYLNPIALIPVAGFGILLLKFRAYNQGGTKLFLGATVGIFLFFSALFPFVANGTFPTLSLSAFFRTVSFFPWYLETVRAENDSPRNNVEFESNIPPTNNIIFVVDESIRPDHLSINHYRRSTTPFLLELQNNGRLYNWGNAVAGATCSITSNRLLLTGNNPDQLGETNSRPTIFQYAKAMGYQTHYFDGSEFSRQWNGKNYDRQFIDTWYNASMLPTINFDSAAGYDFDNAIAEKINQLLIESGGNFVWINKRGVHYNYNGAYPPSEAVWQPIWVLQDKYDIFGINPENRDSLVNSYDNGIRYNLDRFFQNLLGPNLSLLDNTVVVYTSDHGQTLSDHGEHWTHCRDSKNEALVPLFIAAKPGYAFNTQYNAGHSNLFATLLDLMQFPPSKRNYDYAESLLATNVSTSEDRYYFAVGSSKVINFDSLK